MHASRRRLIWCILFNVNAKFSSIIIKGLISFQKARKRRVAIELRQCAMQTHCVNNDSFEGMFHLLYHTIALEDIDYPNKEE